jgi:hypothetical protein
MGFSYHIQKQFRIIQKFTSINKRIERTIYEIETLEDIIKEFWSGDKSI